MATPPLNYFKRVTVAATTTPTVVYTAPTSPNRAGILLSALATNLTNSSRTVTVSLSTVGVPGSYYDILKEFPIPAGDALNVAVGKIVLATEDSLIVSASDNSAVNFTVSILEAINTQ
jgi:hypothetical protein